MKTASMMIRAEAVYFLTLWQQQHGRAIADARELVDTLYSILRYEQLTDVNFGDKRTTLSEDNAYCLFTLFAETSIPGNGLPLKEELEALDHAEEIYMHLYDARKGGRSKFGDSEDYRIELQALRQRREALEIQLAEKPYQKK
jgi:hypothetical protein